LTSLGCNFICTLKIAREVRRARPDIPILLGGPHASILDREILERFDQFDLIVRGEAEQTIGPVLTALSGSSALTGVNGLTYRLNGRVRRTRDAGPILDLDALPMPAYDAYPIERLGLNRLDIDAGRGCPFSCSFCSTASFFGRRYRIKSADRLVNELDALAVRYGIRSFNLTHDLFTVNKQSVRNFCGAVAGRGYTWNCSARMDCVDDALLEAMHDAGCTEVYYGVETGSQRLQAIVEKRLDLRRFHPTLRSTLALGMSATASFITGFPAETAQDREQTLELMRESMQHYPTGVTLQLHLLAPEPGTALFKQHFDSLAFDGHLSDFNFPLIASSDEATVTEAPDIFACHHYYAFDGRRAGDVAVTEGFRALYGLGHVVLSSFASRYSGTLAEMLCSFSTIRRGARDDAEALVEFARRNFGTADPLYDIALYLVAAGQLEIETAASLIDTPPRGHIRLTRQARPIAKSHDGAELLRRLRAGEGLESVPLERSAYVLVAAQGNLAARRLFAVDDVTYEILIALRQPTTYARLADAFGTGALDARLSALALMGVLVSADEAVIARDDDQNVDSIPSLVSIA
jgi:hypothetical protein